jgi:pilus assembly protein CpaE
MGKRVTAVLIESESKARKEMESVFRQRAEDFKLLGTVSDIDEGLTLIKKTGPMVVILEVKDIDVGLITMKEILSQSPCVAIYATSADQTSKAILRMMRAGATEYFVRPVAAAELENALQKLTRLQITEPEHASSSEGTVLAVYNPIGGVGVTTIAVNLAAGLVSKDTNVVLVDLNRFSGDIVAFLDINPTYTLSTITSDIGKLDANFLSSILTNHRSGLKVLADPREVYEAVSIKPEEIRRVLSFLKNMFTYVLVDTGGYADRQNMAVFEVADQVFYTFVPSLPSLRNTKRFLVSADRMGIPMDKIKLIANRYRAKDDIKIKDMEKVLDHPIFFSIPNDYEAVVNSINKGMPCVGLYPKSPVSAAITKLAGEVRMMFAAGN